MNIFTKRNALLGWLVYLVARRRIEQRAERHRVRNGILAGLGVAVGAAAAAVFWTRRAHDEPARA
jgi:hypothetical protein